MEIVHTEIDIEAPRDVVWRTLTDFDSYPEWNPFVRRVKGEMRPGSRLSVTVDLPGSRPTTFRPTLLRFEPNVELRWRGRLFVPGLFDGEHCFLVEDFRPDRVRFFQREIFRGVLVGMAHEKIEAARRGFEAMNAALRDRAERAAGAARS